MSRITLKTFWTESVEVEEGNKRRDSLLEEKGAKWAASFLLKTLWTFSLLDTRICPSNHQNVDCSDPGIVRDICSRYLPKTRGSTIIAIAYGRPEEFIILTRYSEQMRENVKNLICGKNDVIITTNFIYNKNQTNRSRRKITDTNLICYPIHSQPTIIKVNLRETNSYPT